jgi:hypothetical protein
MSLEASETKSCLRRAFAPDISTSESLSHEDCLALRSQLASLSPEDVRECLPAVLIDLVDSHTNDMNTTENVEEVIWFLNPDEDELGEDSDGGLAALSRHKARVFDSFSLQESAAVARWLQLAITWGDLQLCRDQVEMALRYWAKKAAISAD